jgi:hypothetical protein
MLIKNIFIDLFNKLLHWFYHLVFYTIPEYKKKSKKQYPITFKFWCIYLIYLFYVHIPFTLIISTLVYTQNIIFPYQLFLKLFIVFGFFILLLIPICEYDDHLWPLCVAMHMLLMISSIMIIISPLIILVNLPHIFFDYDKNPSGIKIFKKYINQMKTKKVFIQYKRPLNYLGSY